MPLALHLIFQLHSSATLIQAPEFLTHISVTVLFGSSPIRQKRTYLRRRWLTFRGSYVTERGGRSHLKCQAVVTHLD